MDKKQQILRKLKESQEYLSGQQLSEARGAYRTAVWKIIGKLKQEGYPIEAVTNKGYRLLSVEDRDIFNKEEVENRLRTRWAGHPLLYSEETGSTNNDIFALSDQGFPHGTLALTGTQTAGKGRRGRLWISPPDVNIYMSILLRPDLRPESAPMLTLVMALAVYQACEALYSEENVQFGIKWPNDIVVSRAGGPCRKICGILTEMRLEEKEIRDIVIGIGLNVNQDEFPEEIRETAGSLKLALGRDVGRAELTAEIWRHFEKDYEAFTEVQSLAPLKEEYERGLVNRGRRVRVLSPVDPFEGTAIGITDTGELTVRPDDGSPDREVASGEVSVRGVMGYV